MNKVIQGDCLEKLKDLEDNSVDSIVTDPPYHLVSIVKRFGKEGSAPAKEGKDGSFKRLSCGFMGKTWDGVDENGKGIAYNVDMWKECLRVLKPGGHLLAFGGTRTYHRMASAIEDAGFEIRDMIEWVYGSGFPKSLDIGKAVDKLQGNEREYLGEVDKLQSYGYEGNNCFGGDIDRHGKMSVTKGNSEWEGWGTALKPAHEPICMARKPLAEKTVASNVLKYGTGGINIDESRVESKPRLTGTLNKGEEIKAEPTSFKGSGTRKLQTGYDEKMAESNLGRFPANLIHDNSEEVRECFPETKSSKGSFKAEDYEEHETSTNFTRGDFKGRGDSGNASRFFKSIIYQAKASKAERNRGCEGLEDKIGGSMCANTGNTMDLGGASLKGEKKQIQNTKNNHPTVKPIALMEYLIKMVTPKGGIVLDPFAGSGSTLVAAKQNGFQYIGIELTEEYIPIIEARLNALNQYKLL